MSELGPDTASPVCEASMSIECGGFGALTPPIKVTDLRLLMRACAPCGGTEIAPEPIVTAIDLDDAISATLLQHCVKRQRVILDTVSEYPWLEPAESGEEQLEAWSLARRIIGNSRKMLGVVAGTLWLATQNGGFGMESKPSTEVLAKLPVANAHGQEMHMILQQNGLVELEKSPVTKMWNFLIKEGNPGVWFELAMVPQVHALVQDLSGSEADRLYSTYESYDKLVQDLRSDLLITSP